MTAFRARFCKPRPWLRSTGSFDMHRSRQPDQERATFGLGFFPDGHNSDVKFPYTRPHGSGQTCWDLYQLRCQVYTR